MIDAIYLISRSGVPIYYFDVKKGSSEDVEKANLFSGIVSAIQAALSKINAGSLDFFTTKKSEIFLEATENYVMAVVCSKDALIDHVMINKLMANLITAIEFQMPNEGFIAIQQDIDKLVKRELLKFHSQKKESQATKKLKDSLW